MAERQTASDQESHAHQVPLPAPTEGPAANGIASLMDYVGSSVLAVAATAQRFKNQLPAALSGLPHTTYGFRQPLADALRETTTAVDKALAAADEVKQLDLKRAAAMVRSSGRAR